jgi:RNA polymerase sigma-70 factor (ECF subfamily)
LGRFFSEELRRDRTLSLRGSERAADDGAAASAKLDLAAVYAAQKGFVWLTLQRMGIRRPDLEDVFQDVFVIVHKRLHTYNPDAKLTAWLYGICLRSVARHRRRAFRRHEKIEGVDADVALPGAESWHAQTESPDESLRRREREAALHALLDTLDPEHRVVVTMFEIEDQSCADIADLIGVPVGTVHSRLHNARRKLAQAAERRRLQGGAP